MQIKYQTFLDYMDEIGEWPKDPLNSSHFDDWWKRECAKCILNESQAKIKIEFKNR